ncbi:MAG: BatA domain-containing protein [Holophagales bacterium]|nr:BatA domain-containing protein [Holophagales bacterium]
MSFLLPFLGLAALGVGVPLWLHLRHRRPKNLLPFSTLRFLEDQPEPRQGSLRLRHPWLLALRALAVALLALGFSWPYLDAAPEGVTSSTVHLIDATLSRRADVTPEGDAFRRDVDRVTRRLASAPAREQHAVVVLEGTPRVLAGFGDGREAAIRALAELEASHQRGSYLDALRLGQTLLDRGLGEARTLHVYGDFQANQWSEHETTPPFLRDLEVVLDGQAPASPRAADRASAVPRPWVPNAAVGAPQWRRIFVGDVTWVDLVLDLYHQGSLETVRVVVEVGGKAVIDRRLDLREAPPVVSLQAQWRAEPERWQVGQVWLEAEGDVLAEDDRAHFSVPPVAEGRVELISRSPFLEVALSPEVMAGRWRLQRLDPADPEADRPVSRLADVLVLDASYLQADAVRRLMARQLSNGKGVVLFVDRVTPLVKGALRPFGIEPSPTPAAPAAPAAGVGAAAGDAADGEGEAGGHGTPDGDAERLRFVAMQHPIFRPFGERDLGDLSEIRLRPHPALDSARARPLIFGPRSEPALYQAAIAKGRLLVFGFAMELSHTDWPLHPSFLPFLDLTLQFARAATPLQTAWLPGELFRFRPETVSDGLQQSGPAETDPEWWRKLRLYRLDSSAGDPGEGPDLDGSDTAVRADPAGMDPGTTAVRVAMAEPEMVDGELRLTLPDLPGVYRLEYGDGSTMAVLAVDPPVEESRLVYDPDPAALSAWRLPEAASAAVEADPREPPGEDLASPPPGSPLRDPASGGLALPRQLASLSPAILEQHWWWWALAGALAFLFGEHLLLLLRRESP